MTPRPSATKIHELADELVGLATHVRAITTEPLPQHKGRDTKVDTPMVTLMAMAPNRSNNRSYIVSAREHAEDVLSRRERMSPENARQTWGLMRDMFELLPHARICTSHDALLGREVDADGSMTLADGTYVPPNAHLSFTANCIAQAAPDASVLKIIGIREARPRIFVELTDADGGLMLATDVGALLGVVRSMLVPSNDDDANYQKRRLHQWMTQMGIEREEYALHALSAIHTIARLDVADTWHLTNCN